MNWDYKLISMSHFEQYYRAVIEEHLAAENVFFNSIPITDVYFLLAAKTTSSNKKVLQNKNSSRHRQ